MSDSPHFRTTERDGILTFTLTRPAKLNAMGPEIMAGLWDAVMQVQDRDDLRVLLITAEGKYFTAGVDLAAPVGTRSGNPETKHLHPGWNRRRNARSFTALFDEMEAVEKPVVMAIQGISLGVGIEMACSCDFRFCAATAEFALPEVRLGVIASSGGTSRLTRLIGPHWAKYLAMAGMRIGAEQAKAIGFVHDVFPPETLQAEVVKFCRGLTEISAEALGTAKAVVDLAADSSDRNLQRQVDRFASTPLVGKGLSDKVGDRFKK